MRHLPQTGQRLRVKIVVLLMASTSALPAFSANSGRSYPKTVSVSAPGSSVPSLRTPGASERRRAASVLAGIAPSFEPNNGQFDPAVKFFSRGEGYTLSLRPGLAVLTLEETDRAAPRSTNHDVTGNLSVRMRFEGANPNSSLEGLDRLAGTTNYFTGSDPGQWQTGVPNYGKVVSRGIYPGVDVVYYGACRGNHREVEYDLTVSPGISPDVIRLSYEGALSLRTDGNGDLVLSTRMGDVRQRKPIVYQEIEGIRTQIGARYVLRRKHRVGFHIDSYDKRWPLTIDPVLTYSTYFGPSNTDGRAIALDAQGNIYVAGDTDSSNLPTTRAAFQKNKPGGMMILKLNSAGTQVLYCTYVSGKKGGAVPYAIATDGNGSAYVTGFASGPDFPTTHGAYRTTSQGSRDDYNVFVTKLSPDGGSLSYSTFIGQGLGFCIAVDPDGDAYVGGYSNSTDFPTTPGAFQTGFLAEGDAPAFVTKLNPAGSSLVYSTFLGGESLVSGIALDRGGYAYVTGKAYNGIPFPVTDGAYNKYSYDNYNNNIGTFVTKLNPDGTGLVYSALADLGEQAFPRVAIDAAGCAYVTGATTSMDFPAKNAIQPKLSGGQFVRSDDGGTAWSSVDRSIAYTAPGSSSRGEILVRRFVTALAVDPGDPLHIYAAAQIFKPENGLAYEVLRSIDGGTTWDAAPAIGKIGVISVDPVNTSNVYAGAGSSILKSTDGGLSWRSAALAVNQASMNAIVVDPINPSRVYATAGFFLGGNATGSGGMFRSTDAGSTWTKMGDSIGAVDFLTLAIDPGDPSRLFAGCEKGIFISLDAGANWLKTSVTVPALAIAIDPSNPAILYASTIRYGSVSALSDAGRRNTRRRIQSIDETPGSGVLKSTDGGATWNSVSGLQAYGTGILAIDPDRPSTLYLALNRGLYKSTDSGQNWTQTSLSSVYATSLVVAPTRPSSIYLAGLYVPTDDYVVKFDPAGSSLVYSTYLGGLEDELTSSINVDAQGNAYIAGTTLSVDFPITADTLQRAPQSGDLLEYYQFVSGFITELNPAGGMVFSTLFGTNAVYSVNGIAIDSKGSAYVTGFSSEGLPTVNPIQTVGFSCAFVAKISPAGPVPILDLAITGVSVSNFDALLVEGRGFAPGAAILVNGHAQKTINDDQTPASRLLSKRALSRLTPGIPAYVQIQNPDGALSQEMLFTRQF